MKIAFYLAHPSQYYVFKNIVNSLMSRGHKIYIFIKSKDILERLLISEGISYINAYPHNKKKGLIGLLCSVFLKNKALFANLKIKKIDLLVTAASDSSQVSFLLGLPSIVFNDDDAPVIRKSALFGWPFSSAVLAPKSCKMGYWRKKTVFYNGYQKLAYLHPKYFQPDQKIVQKYGLSGKPYFLIRTVSLSAHHDKNIRGLNNDLVEKLITILSPHGKVFISSEKKLPPHLQTYKLNINPLDIHHLIYFSSLLVGDSQSMAHEAALLGTPSVRYNDFVGRIGVLEELEHTYQLTFGISPDNPNLLLYKVRELVLLNDKTIFQERAKKMIENMIDLPSFAVWFIENYPESKSMITDQPEFWNQFK